MMSQRLTAIATALCSICLPMTAHAYLTPDEVLNEGDFSTNFYEEPPSKREVEERAEEQRRRSAERREAEQAALENHQDPEEEEEEPTHEAAPEEPTDEEEMTLEELLEALEALQGSEGMEEDATVSAEEQRLLERLRDRQRAEAYEAWIASQGGQTHGGAPLSETGPATTVAVIIGALAIGETWRRVRKMEKA